jgi:hypothetical protein
VPSAIVARVQGDPAKHSVWYPVHKKDIPKYDEAWRKVFGDASTESALAEENEVP